MPYAVYTLGEFKLVDEKPGSGVPFQAVGSDNNTEEAVFSLYTSLHKKLDFEERETNWKRESLDDGFRIYNRGVETIL